MLDDDSDEEMMDLPGPGALLSHENSFVGILVSKREPGASRGI